MSGSFDDVALTLEWSAMPSIIIRSYGGKSLSAMIVWYSVRLCAAVRGQVSVDRVGRDSRMV